MSMQESREISITKEHKVSDALRRAGMLRGSAMPPAPPKPEEKEIEEPPGFHHNAT